MAVPPFRTRLVKAILLFALMLVPLVAVELLFDARAVALCLPGVVMAAVAMIMLGQWRWALIGTGVLSVTTFISVLVVPHPIIAVLWLALVGVGIGVNARIGYRSIGIQVALWTAFPIFSPRQLDITSKLQLLETPHPDARLALLSAVGVLIGGAAMTMLAAWLLPARPAPAARPADRRTAIVMSIATGVILGMATWVVLTYAHVPGAFWMVMTIILLVQNDSASTIRRTAERVVGTIAGAIVAAAIAEGVEDTRVHAVLGVVCLIVAIAFIQDPRRYGVFVVFLTPAIVLLSAHNGAYLETDLVRVGFTVLGGAVVLGTVLLLRALERGPGVPARPAA